MASSMGEPGAGLVEILIVLTIIAFATAVLGGGFGRAASRQRAWSVVTAVAGDLRVARREAIRRRAPVRVVLAPSLPQLSFELPTEGNRLLRRSVYESHGVQIGGLSNGPSVTFFPSGRSATPTTIRFRSLHGEQKEMTVSITGRVTIQ